MKDKGRGTRRAVLGEGVEEATREGVKKTTN